MSRKNLCQQQADPPESGALSQNSRWMRGTGKPIFASDISAIKKRGN
jgi:hypothetical protein